MRKTLTDRGVVALKPRPQRFAYPDPELTGHYVRVTPAGGKTFSVVARAPNGKQVWAAIGAADAMPIEEARKRARAAIGRIRDGLSAFETAPDTFAAIAEQWLVRHVEAKRLITNKQIRRFLRVHVFPVWGDRPFLSIRRSDVAELLDRVEDNHGARQADMVLTVVRSIMNWYATRNDAYSVPVVRGMRRQDQSQHARARVLDDAELAAIWKTAEGAGTFGGILRLCLLTAQRRTKISAMKWADISLDGDWTIPKEPREKDTAGTLVLPETALAIIRAQPRLVSNPHVFAGRQGGPFSGFSVTKTSYWHQEPLNNKDPEVKVPNSLLQLMFEIFIYGLPKAKRGTGPKDTFLRYQTIAVLVRIVSQDFGFPKYTQYEHRGDPDAPMSACRLVGEELGLDERWIEEILGKNVPPAPPPN